MLSSQDLRSGLGAAFPTFHVPTRHRRGTELAGSATMITCTKSCRKPPQDGMGGAKNTTIAYQCARHSVSAQGTASASHLAHSSRLPFLGEVAADHTRQWCTSLPQEISHWKLHRPKQGWMYGAGSARSQVWHSGQRHAVTHKAWRERTATEERDLHHCNSEHVHGSIQHLERGAEIKCWGSARNLRAPMEGAGVG